MTYLCTKHYGYCVGNSLKKVKDGETSQEVATIIHVRNYDGQSQSSSSQDGKKYLDSDYTSRWNPQDLFSPACGCVL